MEGITNQRETTLCWSKSTGKPLCNAIVWDDARTSGIVREFEKKLDEVGIDIDEEDEELEGVPENVEIGTGTQASAIGETGKVEKVETVTKAMKSLGVVEQASNGKKKRKGKEGLVDM